jgi:hypothetical protein
LESTPPPEVPSPPPDKDQASPLPPKSSQCLSPTKPNSTAFSLDKTDHAQPPLKTVFNVVDRRHGWIGGWEIGDYSLAEINLTDDYIGRTVIYINPTTREAGTLTSFNDELAFARYTTGETAAGANKRDLYFAIRPLDGPEKR